MNVFNTVSNSTFDFGQIINGRTIFLYLAVLFLFGLIGSLTIVYNSLRSLT